MFCIANASSMYPIEFGVLEMRAEIPSLPFAPRPPGQLTLVPVPGPLFHAGLTVLR